MRVTQPAAICASSPTFVSVMHQREKMLDERACLEEEEENGRNICKYTGWLGSGLEGAIQ